MWHAHHLNICVINIGMLSSLSKKDDDVKLVDVMVTSQRYVCSFLLDYKLLVFCMVKIVIHLSGDVM